MMLSNNVNIYMDRAMNPHDGSRRRLKSSAHKSKKDYDRKINKQIKEEIMESVVESDKLIAEFMGLAYCTRHNYEGWYRNSEFNHRICGYNGLKYHSDWNLLMTVVDKIVNLKDVYAQDRQKVFKSISPNITITYNTVVAFIKWYNAAANTKDKE